MTPAAAPADSTAAAFPFRLHYIDDSGSDTSGLTTFTWLQLHPPVWAAAQKAWLTFRRDLYERHAIPASRRLHATDLAGGRRNPSLDPGWDIGRHGGTVIREGLKVIAGLHGVQVATVYRHTAAAELPVAKRALYRRLVKTLDTDLRVCGQMGIVFMDGDGSDRSYAAAHRDLPAHRHLIEAPVFRHADTDQWVQMADLAAWSAFQALHRKRTRRQMWSWYPSILGSLDAFGGPLEL